MKKQKRNEIPSARKEPHIFINHGNSRVDNYVWMHDKNNPDVINYLQNWNQFTDNFMENTKPLQEKIFTEIINRIEEESTSVPVRIGNYYYYTRREKGKEHPISCRKLTPGSDLHGEEVLLDHNVQAEKFDYFQVQDFDPREDGKFGLFSVDTKGTQFSSIWIKNLVSDEIIEEEKIPDCDGSFEWSNDDKGFWYVKIDDTMRSDKVYYHKLGTKIEDDILIFHEEDELYDVGIDKSRDDRFLFFTSTSSSESEVSFVKADHVGEHINLIHPREKDFEYYIESCGNVFYIKVKKGNNNSSLMVTDVSNLCKDGWLELIPVDQDVEIEDIDCFENHLVITKRNRGLVFISIVNRNSGNEHTIQLQDAIYEVYIGDNPYCNTNILRFCYSSPVTPKTTYEYDMNTRNIIILKRVDVGNFDPLQYCTERIFAPTADGTRIPISIFYKKGLVWNGNNPMRLYAYGSYGITCDTNFSPSEISLVDRGMVCAIAHIRGSGYMGRKWYEDGRLMNKKNTFNDFIDSAEFLIKQGYTNKNKLVIQGGSAGGLLMGVVVNMRPDLFKAVIAEVPFVDVMTTMFDTSLPLTTQEWEEWGNPEEYDFYQYMLEYSPYDNVHRENYPAMWITAGLNDAQVSYREPTKWVARICDQKINDMPILFKINMKAGHHSFSGRYEAYKEVAEQYAFILGFACPEMS